MGSKSKFVVRIMFAALLLSAAPMAQISSRSGALTGIVTDKSGAVVSGAQVLVRNQENNRTRELTSDQEGSFRALELEPGAYQVEVHAAGFAPYRRTDVIVPLGQSPRIAVELAISADEKAVTVTGEAPVLDPSQSAMQSAVDTERIEELPVRSRNYLNFVLLAPAISQSPQRAGASAGTSLPDSGFVFGGLRPRSNNITVDGVDNNDEYTGRSRTELSLEAVREFVVVSSGISAESGGASGGSINVVTRNGANAFHGDAFVFAENGAWDARPALEDNAPNPDLARYRAGVALGGPIVRDRTFFYAAAEQEHLRAQDASDIGSSPLSAINSFLARGGAPLLSTRSLSTSLSPVAMAETEASLKLNHQLSDRHSLMMRYTFTNNRESGGAFNETALQDASARGSEFLRDHAWIGSLTSLLSNTAVNDVRVQIASRNAVMRTRDASGPGVEISGVAAFGRPFDGNGSRRENHYELTDSITLLRGSHLLKAGAVVNRVHLSAAMLDGFGGTFLFGGLPQFLAGTPDQYRQTFGSASTAFGVTAAGVFLQDHWTATRSITVDAGLRYDVENLPDRFHRDTNNVSPRIGIAWRLGDRWLARAGFGLYYDRYVLAFLDRAMQQDGVHAFEQIASGAAAASIFASRATPATALAGIAPSVFVPQPLMATPYSEVASVGVERQITTNISAKANLLFTHGVKLPRTINVNLAPPVVLTSANAATLGVTNPTPQQLGRAAFGLQRVDSHYDAVYQRQDAAGSRYHGVSLTLNRQFAGDSAFSASYTYSKAFDDASDFDEQPQNPYDLRGERALSRYDQRHRLVFNALFDLGLDDEDKSTAAHHSLWEQLARNWEAGPILTVASGTAVTPLVGIDANQSRAWPLSSRPMGASRNSLRTPLTAVFDLRLLRYIPLRDKSRIDFVVESFNLLNHRNVTDINPFFGTGAVPQQGYRVPIGAVNSRKVQLSLDYEF